MNSKSSNDSILDSFAKKRKSLNARETSTAVIYTRVSSKEQEDNSSLESQKRCCEEFCKRKGIHVIQYFGGTSESAQKDDRKEFNRMLNYVKKNTKVDSIVVYSLDRFSRTGGNAIHLTEELLKIGVRLHSVTQEADANTPAGKLQKNMILLFGQFDNDVRREKIVKGMIENLRKGYWVSVTPLGYTNLNRKEKAKYHKYVINKDGELLKLGFKWKAEGLLSNVEIVKKLRRMGSKIEYKSFVRILSNPFYCGYITSSLIPGEIHMGNHPPLISLNLFKTVNKKISDNPYHGIPKNGEIIDLPLKAFMKDEISLSPFTGYQQKGIFYYKTRAKGSRVNVKADRLNEKFRQELRKYSLDQQLTNRLREMVLPILESKFQEQLIWEINLKKQAAELKTKINKLHERYIDGDFDQAVYVDFKQKYELQLKEIEATFLKPNQISSNLEKSVLKGIKLATNLSLLWDTTDFKNKQQLQKLVFPEGMFYNKQNNTVRTPRVNSVFALIADQARVSGEKNDGQLLKNDHHSHWVVPTGIEPVSKV